MHRAGELHNSLFSGSTRRVEAHVDLFQLHRGNILPHTALSVSIIDTVQRLDDELSGPVSG
jgi:hypothetical protein